MNTEEFTNKMNTLFPQMSNANAEGNTFGTTTELWKGVADKSADTISSILAPVKNFILDVQPDLQVRNPNACPVVQVEVISSMGGALVDNADWDKSAINNKYVDVKLHRISRPFILTSYDLMRGERVESKVAAAMKEVAQGVVNQFMVKMQSPLGGDYTTLSKFDPETCATISGAFGEKAETDTLLLDPVNYAKIIPTNALALNPEAQGSYGIGHIYKTTLNGSDANAIALTKDAVAGAVATPEIVTAYGSQGMQYLGEVAGIPMVLISTWDYSKQAVKCSVETMAGFTLTDTAKIKRYTVEG